jgi:hypothetical protein
MRGFTESELAQVVSAARTVPIDRRTDTLAARVHDPSRKHLYLIGSSWNRVGDFWGWMSDNAVDCLGILHFGRAWNLASMMDGASNEAKPAALGYVFVPWF